MRQITIRIPIGLVVNIIQKAVQMHSMTIIGVQETAQVVAGSI